MTIKEAVKGNGTPIGIMSSSGMIKKAESMLMENESVEFACVYNVYSTQNDGKIKVTDTLKVKNKVPGVTVLTNKRIFFCSSILGNVNSKQIKIQDIQSADYSSLMGLATVRIKGITEMIIIEATKKTAEELIKKINQIQLENNSQTTQTISNISTADEILKFKQLLDEGIITKDEFEKKKQELLK